MNNELYNRKKEVELLQLEYILKAYTKGNQEESFRYWGYHDVIFSDDIAEDMLYVVRRHRDKMKKECGDLLACKVENRLEAKEPLQLKELFNMIDSTKFDYKVKVVRIIDEVKQEVKRYFSDSVVKEVDISPIWDNEIVVLID
jgi:hypothetical protein